MDLITSSAWWNEAQASVGGVGLPLSTTAKKSLTGVRSHSDRILIATFQGNPATSVIVTSYKRSKIKQSKMETVEGYYADLRRAIKSLPVHNLSFCVTFMQNWDQAMPRIHTMKKPTGTVNFYQN